MKKRAILLAIPIAALGLGSCGKKSETARETEPAAETTAGTPVQPEPSAAEPEIAALTAAQRAEKFGFARHLPPDTEAFTYVFNGSKTVSAVSGSKIWALLSSEMGMGADIEDLEMEEMEFDEMDDEDFAIPEGEQDDEAGMDEFGDDFGIEDEDFPQPLGPEVILGREFGIALGGNGGDQAANLITAYSRYSYFSVRMFVRGLIAQAEAGDPSAMSEAMMEQVMALPAKLLNDPKGGVGLIERLQVPPLYVSFRVDEAQREAAAQELASSIEFLTMAEGFVEPVDLEKAGASFSGYRLVGENMAAGLEETRVNLEGMLDEESIDKLIDAISRKDVVIASGILGEYVVLYIGPSVDAFQLVAEADDSILAGDALAFADRYADRELALLSYGDQDAAKAMLDAYMQASDLATPIRDEIAGDPFLGDTRDLEAMLQIVADREKALRALATVETTGIAGFFEDGLMIECHGGMDSGGVNWEQPSKLPSLGASPDVVFFASATSEAAYDEAATAYLEALGETAYAMAMKFAEYDIETPEFQQFREMAGLFDEKFRPHAAELWSALTGDFADGLGNESALVVDLKGGMPALPGVPQQVVDEAKFVRASLIAPVEDRTKLAASWERMNSATTRLLASASELAGTELPMPKPMSSESNGYKTWFFALQFADDDFIPSVTIGDDWFVASTSKLHALELIDQVKATPEAGLRTGMHFKMDFAALQQFARETMTVVENNADAIFGGNEAARAEFEEQKETIKQWIDALDELDRFTMHGRRENGELRTTLHFKTR